MKIHKHKLPSGFIITGKFHFVSSENKTREIISTVSPAKSRIEVPASRVLIEIAEETFWYMFHCYLFAAQVYFHCLNITSS